MITHITDDRARFLAAQVTQDDGGAHAVELLELLDGTSDSANAAGNAAKDYLRRSLSGECVCATSADAESRGEAYQPQAEVLSDLLSVEH